MKSDLLNLGLYLVPLAVCKINASSAPKLTYMVDRYAGTAFYVGNEAQIATCKHIIQSVGPNEVLMGLNIMTSELKPIGNIKTHPKFDFATGVLPRSDYKRFQLLDAVYPPGHDVRASAFINVGKIGNDVTVSPRLYKGHIVGTSEVPQTPDARSTVLVSFPSHRGFSGAPLLSTESGAIVGMLYSNAESSIETFRYQEVADDGKEFSEVAYRIVEEGLAHSAKDILQFLKELG
jgi:hypothetical protein